jgi:uncharacterized protein YndB with AHSA1/START domain
MHSIETSVFISARPDAVFEALTDPARIAEYYPVTSVRSTRRIGGDFIIEGEGFTDHGIIRSYAPPMEFGYEYWSTNHGTENVPANRMRITYSLAPSDGGTLLSVTHDNLLTSDRIAAMGPVWEFLLGQLKAYCERATEAAGPRP